MIKRTKIETLKTKITKTLNKYSSKSKLDLNYFVKSGFWISLSIVIDIILSFIFSYTIANYMTKTESGRFYFIISLISLFALFGLQGFIILATNKFLKKKYYFYKVTIIIKFIGNALGTIVLTIISVFVYYLKIKIWHYFIMVAIIAIFSNFDLYIRYLYTRNKFREITTLLVSKSILYYGITSIIIYTQKFNTISIVIIYFAIQAIFDLICYIYYYKRIDIKTEKVTRRDLKDGLFHSTNIILSTVSANIDKIILPILFNLENLAIYSFALIIPKAMSQIFEKFAFFTFYKKLYSQKWEDLKIKFLGFFLLLCIGTSILVISTPFLYNILYAQYKESILYAQLLMCLIPIMFSNLIFIKYNESNNNPKIIFKNNMITQLTQIGFYVLTIPFFGIAGIIITRYIKELLMLTIYLFSINNKKL